MIDAFFSIMNSEKCLLVTTVLFSTCGFVQQPTPPSHQDRLVTVTPLLDRKWLGERAQVMYRKPLHSSPLSAFAASMLS